MLDSSREGRDWQNERHRSNRVPMGGSYTRRVFTEAHLEKLRQDIEGNEAPEGFAYPEAVLQKADVISSRFYRLLANRYSHRQTTTMEESRSETLDPEQTSALATMTKEGRLFLERIPISHESTDNAFKARIISIFQGSISGGRRKH